MGHSVLLVAPVVALLFVSICARASTASPASHPFLRTKIQREVRVLSGACPVEGENDCEKLDETACGDAESCTWPSDANCCEDGSGPGPMPNLSLPSNLSEFILELVCGVIVITLLNMVCLAIVYHHQHLANISKGLLAKSSQAQGTVLETVKKESSGEGATTYTYFTSYQVCIHIRTYSHCSFYSA